MKKILVVVMGLFFLTACNSKGYDLNLPDGWTLKEETESQIVLEAPGVSENLPKKTYNVRIVSKPAETPFTVWLLEEKDKLGSSFVDVCSDLISSKTSNAYNCGTTTPEYYLVNTADDRVMILFPGENTSLMLADFQNMVELD